jgi:hypothetical protein
MKILFWIMMVFSIISCGPTLRYYTNDVRELSGLNPDNLRNVQFYLSDDIILWRELSRGELSIFKGKIKMTEGKKVEEITIKKGTPGVFLFSPKSHQYAISFDSHDDTHYLVFGPSDKVKGRYVLLAKYWDARYGQVTYGDNVYNTPAQSAYACLMVDMKHIKSTQRSTEVVKGRKINQ